MERVVITGIGLVSPVGIGTLESWRALLAGESGVGPVTLFDTKDFRVRIAGEVKGWEPTRFIEKKKLKEMDRFDEFALGAAALAIQDSKLELTDEEREEAGCFSGVEHLHCRAVLDASPWVEVAGGARPDQGTGSGGRTFTARLPPGPLRTGPH